jgi:hypothetical protein
VERDDDDYGHEPETAIWCLHCERVFLWKDRRWTRQGLIECAYTDCDGNPLDFLEWEADHEIGKRYATGSPEVVAATLPAQERRLDEYFAEDDGLEE